MKHHDKNCSIRIDGIESCNCAVTNPIHKAEAVLPAPKVPKVEWYCVHDGTMPEKEECRYSETKHSVGYLRLDNVVAWLEYKAKTMVKNAPKLSDEVWKLAAELREGCK